DDEKKEYALALVSCAEHKTLFVSAFGGARVRTRIERILSFKKMTAASAVLSAVLIAAIAYFLLTNAY
ncbi:MAG: peptidase M56 BlaR1, partial [Clostridia bacterium]|nr:peptidase M56 BlaR1 [Clostridia bacterium]